MMKRLLFLALMVLASCQVVAQDVRVKVAMQDSPFYVGEPAVIQFTVEGLDEQPEPTCELGNASGKSEPGIRGVVSSVNPSVMSQIVQRNGQLFQSRRVTHQINYQVTAEQSGDFEVGPFLIKQGGKETSVEPISMSFRPVPLDPSMQIRLMLPDTPLYPDQRVPVGIEWWYGAETDKILSLSIYTPLFDQFRFGPDEQPTRRSVALPVETKAGRLALLASTREEPLDGKRMTVFSAQRTLIPQRPGEYTLAPISVTLRRATGWARPRAADDDDFGFGGSFFREFMEERRRPSKIELIRAVGEPLKIVIRPFPTDGKPESFAGAVGKGFSIDVAADRTVVRVGDPIGLTVTLRGEGNIDNASLPSLAADGGLRVDQFRLPEGDVPGTLSDGAKQFRVSVRVADESVVEIPALAYSWFDPEKESYQTAKSKPIALRVMSAKIVSAGDVIRSQKAGPGSSGETSSAPGDEQRSAAVQRNATGVPKSTVSGADLTIEPNAGVVLRDEGRGWRGLAIPATLYGAGLLAIIAALVDRRRREQDPTVAARGRLIREQRQRIVRAASLPKRDAATEISAAMRCLIAAFPEAPREAGQSVIGDCEAIAFSPDKTSDLRLDEALVSRARKAAEEYGV